MITKIWIYNGWTNINPSFTINTTRRLNSFCVNNCLPNSIYKSQGGYYMLTSKGTLKFLERSLCNMTFQEVYDLYKKEEYERS